MKKPQTEGKPTCAIKFMIKNKLPKELQKKKTNGQQTPHVYAKTNEAKCIYSMRITCFRCGNIFLKLFCFSIILSNYCFNMQFHVGEW